MFRRCNPTVEMTPQKPPLHLYNDGHCDLPKALLENFWEAEMHAPYSEWKDTLRSLLKILVRTRTPNHRGSTEIKTAELSLSKYLQSVAWQGVLCLLEIHGEHHAVCIVV